MSPTSCPAYIVDQSMNSLAPWTAHSSASSGAINRLIAFPSSLSPRRGRSLLLRANNVLTGNAMTSKTHAPQTNEESPEVSGKAWKMPTSAVEAGNNPPLAQEIPQDGNQSWQPMGNASDQVLATKGIDLQKLPPRFLDFLQSNNIDPAIYSAAQHIPRHIRLRKVAATFQEATPDDVASVEEDLGCKMEPLPWLPGFYCTPASVNIAGTESYRAGRIFGMDAASAAAVLALGVQPGEHVLDLCAAPGAKLTMIADILGDAGSVTAVDVSLPRLAATKTLIVKYKAADRCRLFLGNATKFSYPPPVPPTKPAPWTTHGSRKDKGTAGANAEGEFSADESVDDASPVWPLLAASGPRDVCGGSAPGAELASSDREESEETAEVMTTGAAAAEPQPGSTSVTPEGESKGEDVAEDPRTRRRKSRKERRRAKKLREFNSLGDALAMDHPELFFVGRKAWQWWDPQQDKQALGTASCHCSMQQSQTEREGGEAKEGPSDDNPMNRSSTRLYDKVLVDAECTHDGSFKHVLKFEDWGWDTLDRRFMDRQRLDSLAALQRSLLANGFRMLKPGGLLAYCTCSLTVAQNEDVVRDFLEVHKDAEVLEVQGSSHWPCREGEIPHTLRFDPLTSATGGLFVALMKKHAVVCTE